VVAVVEHGVVVAVLAALERLLGFLLLAEQRIQLL
jgi:hypothetical protein